MFHLLPEGTHSFEISSSRDVGIFGLGHGFRNAEETLLRPAKCAADALRETLRDFLLLGGSGWSYKDQAGENDESGGLHGDLLLTGISELDLRFAHRMLFPHSTQRISHQSRPL